MILSQREAGLKVRRINNYLMRKEIEVDQKQINFLIKEVNNLKPNNKRLSKIAILLFENRSKA